jgi:hypothetical protein
LFDYVIVNRKPVPPRLLRRMGLRYITGDLLHYNRVVRHDQARLTRLLLEEFVKRQLRKL